MKDRKITKSIVIEQSLSDMALGEAAKQERSFSYIVCKALEKYLEGVK